MKPEQSLVERLREQAMRPETTKTDFLLDTADRLETVEACLAEMLKISQERLNRIERLERQLAAPAELPPLPEAARILPSFESGIPISTPHFTADQMREYARAAQRAAPTALTHAMFLAAEKAGVSFATQQKCWNAWFAAAAPQEAPKQEPVAWMLRLPDGRLETESIYADKGDLQSYIENDAIPGCTMEALYAAPISTISDETLVSSEEIGQWITRKMKADQP